MQTRESAPPVIDAGPVESAVASCFLKLAGPSARVLVALSGGPDSVALLVASADEAGKRGVGLSACWVDHALRPAPELSDERGFVMELCKRIGVPILIEEASRGEISGMSSEAGGIESAARIFRYAALERARIASGCGSVLTGHTADDFVETMVMRFCTGSGTAGLRGIPETNGRIVRPLLGVTKAHVYAYLASKGQGYREDSTNASDDYLRNKVRHEVLPVLLSVFPSLRASLGTVSAEGGARRGCLGRNGGRAARSSVDWMRCGYGRGCRQDRCRQVRRGAGLRQDQGAVSIEPSARSTGGFRGAWSRRPHVSRKAIRQPGLRMRHRVRQGRPLRARKTLRTGLRKGGARGVRTHGRDAVSASWPNIQATFRIGKAGTCRIYSTNQAPGLRLDAFSWPLWIRSRRPGDCDTHGRRLQDARFVDVRNGDTRRASRLGNDSRGQGRNSRPARLIVGRSRRIQDK